VSVDIVMPRLSDSMEEGTILQWLKAPGDEIALGEELVEIETDKANMVYEAPAAGSLIEVLADEGDTLAIGEVIARVGEAGEAPSGNGAAAKRESSTEEAEEGDRDGGSPSPVPGSAASRSPRVPAAEAPSAASPSPASEGSGAPGDAGDSPATAAAGGDGRVKASPLARRMALENGLELGGIPGSGPGGRIVKADVERAIAGARAERPPAAPAAPQAAPAEPTPGARERPETAKGGVTMEELTKLQQTVARRMAESKATAPHFYLQVEVDMSRCVEARARLKRSAGGDEVVPSLNDMVVKASAIALREHPRANGAYRDGRLELYERVNVGVAVAAQDALVVPTVFDADRKGLSQIASETRALAQRVRDGTVTPPELSGGTFTVSNLGMFGIDSFAAVINPPQAGILAVGKVAERAVIRDGEVASAHLMPLNLACDHRILYGADGARFLDRIRNLLEEPLGLAL
jgi:pyruvate dehydrogenase E2 component (dihydrolipoyllysine-residue acetyltransferase)